MEADLKGSPAQWKVIARLIKHGGEEQEFDDVMKALGSRDLHNVTSVEEVKKAFNNFEPLPVNDEGKIVLSNKYNVMEAGEDIDGNINFVKTEELTWFDKAVKKHKKVSDSPIIDLSK